ncbi:helix-turn-helix domain-containing protein [Burkholderia ambifaria]
MLIDPKHIGVFLREQREARGFTQADIGAFVGLSQMQISHFEYGRREMKLDTAIDLLNVFGYRVRLDVWPK